MSSSGPDFSVIIPTKDRPAMLRRALDSVLVQRGVDFEIVVADDGAGDGAAMARDLAPRQPLVAFATGRLGQVPARNMALQRAAGRWVAFLDDDDWWAANDYLAHMAEARPDASIVYASGRIVREGPDQRSGDIIGFRAHADPASLRLNNELLISGIAYDRRLHMRLGLFDESLPVYWDWDWYLRLAAAEVRMAPAGTDAVHISVRRDNVTAPANHASRRAELGRLAAKHGLEGLVLKNHEVIALEQAGLSAPP